MLRGPGWCLVLGWLAGLVLVLALVVRGGASMQLDLQVTQEFQEGRAVDLALRPLLIGVTMLGNEPYAAIVFLVAFLGAAWMGTRADVALLSLTLLADGVTMLFKLAVARPRPSGDLIEVWRTASDFSFPSGHVVHFVVFYGLIAILLGRGIANARGADRVVRQLVVLICATLIALIGPSRIYLGAHWLTDVVAGYLVGGFCLFALIAAAPHWWFAVGNDRRARASAIRGHRRTRD